MPINVVTTLAREVDAAKADLDQAEGVVDECAKDLAEELARWLAQTWWPQAARRVVYANPHKCGDPNILRHHKLNVAGLAAQSAQIVQADFQPVISRNARNRTNPDVDKIIRQLMARGLTSFEVNFIDTSAGASDVATAIAESPMLGPYDRYFDAVDRSAKLRGILADLQQRYASESVVAAWDEIR